MTTLLTTYREREKEFDQRWRLFTELEISFMDHQHEIAAGQHNDNLALISRFHRTTFCAAIRAVIEEVEGMKVEVTDCDHNPMSASCDQKCADQSQDIAHNAALTDLITSLKAQLAEIEGITSSH